MGKLEKQHYSIAAKTFRSTIMGAILLGLAALIVGLSLFIYSNVKSHRDSAFDLAKTTKAISSKVVDSVPIAMETMEIYRKAVKDGVADTGSEEYAALFSGITSSDEYNELLSIFKDFYAVSNIDYIYLAMYDKGTDRLVYIVDPDESEITGLSTGYYDEVSSEEVDRFLGWDGRDTLYYISNTEDYGWVCTSGVPVADAEGNIVAFFMADITLEGIGHSILMFFIQYAIVLAIITNLVAFFITRKMKKQLVFPLNSIASAAEAYVKDKKNQSPGTDHFAGLNIKTGDELENLSLIMADMEQDLNDYEENLTRVAADRERINTELSLATRIQADMLPNIYPAFPERPEFDIYATMTPAKEVGGDFYDFFLVDEDHLALVMADVSGKGVPAALFMMISKILIKNQVMNGKSPAQALAAVNAQIYPSNKEEMFVTVWLGILDLNTGLLTAANAGHEYPVIKQPDGEFELVKDRHGFVIGAMDAVRYTEYELTLKEGAKLFVYTDGVPEATDSENELFGNERMINALNTCKDGEPRAVLEKIAESVGQFVGDAPQFDDLTMLCLEYIGKGQK